MKKVLLVYATAGIGHVKACFAVKDALEKHGVLHPEIVDILDYTNKFLKWVYHKLYIILVKHMPCIWAFIYYTLDIKWVYNCIRVLRTSINSLNSKEFINYLCRTCPDIIVSTHFFPSEVISTLKRKNIINPYLISVITDYKLHTYWVSREVDLFVVADEYLKQQLITEGIDERKIRVFGIPIESKFYDPLDEDLLYKKFDIKKDSFIILVASGGFGVGPIEGIVKELISLDIPVELLVICGKNKTLYEDMKELKAMSKHPVNVYSFVDNVHEMMQVSDLLISKSGGMTVSEALAKELPMIVASPIPGQEMRNCEFLVENGAAVREDNPSEIKKKVLEFFGGKRALNIIKGNIRTIKKPNPAMNLADFIEKV